MRSMTKRIAALTLSSSMVLGMSFSALAAEDQNGYKVMVDGQYVTFTDAFPQAKEGRVMVPFTAVLEKMGAQVSYDSETKLVTATKDGTTIKFAPSGTTIEVTANGETKTVAMDVASYAEAGRTYVPTRFLAESFGMGVGWDNSNKTVVIIDGNKFFANADEDFSNLMMLTQTNIDMDKTYKTTGNLNAYISVKEPNAEAIKLGMDGTLTGLSKGMDVDMQFNVKMDIEDVLKLLSEEEKAEIKPVLDALKGMKMDIKMAGKDGMLYMNVPLFAKILPEQFKENTWIKMDMNAYYKTMGLDFQQLLAYSSDPTKFSLSELLPESLLGSENSYNIETYQTSKIVYDVVKNLIGNSAFKTEEANGVKTSTALINADTIQQAVVKAATDNGILNAVNNKDLQELKSEIEKMNLSGKLELKSAEGKLTAYQMDLSMKADDGEFSMSVSSDNILNEKFSLKLAAAEMMELVIDMDAVYEESTGTVDLSIPSDAPVIDYIDFMKSAL